MIRNRRLRLMASCSAFILSSFASLPTAAQDAENGKEVYGPCAACHGDLGQGGKKGEYPRIAGQRAGYLEQQLRLFRDRKRINFPMFPTTEHRDFPDKDLLDVVAYVASIKLSTKVPEFKDTDDALARLLAMEKVMIIPRAEGDVEKGKVHYHEHCQNCHAKDGMGRSDFPMLVGQYTNYLQRQVDLYLKGDRPHDEEGTVGVLNGLKAQDIQDVLAYLTSIQETE